MTTSSDVMISAPARHLFGTVQAMSHSFAARLAERWFFTPPRRPLTREGKAFLRSGRRFALRVDGRRVAGWAWGAGPVVYLVHGWGGRAGRWSGIAMPLIKAGHTVVTYDAPGHGASGRGLSSAVEFAGTVCAIAQRFGPARAVIAHSLGAPAVVLATRSGLVTESVALLAPATEPAAHADQFAAALGAHPEVMARMRANSERRLRITWTELDVRTVAPSMSLPLLVVHDREDATVPFTEGAAIAASWPGARLLATTGLGHRGVLRDPQVATAVMRFVTDKGTTPELMDEAALLEYELFYRECR
jgi:pimeloyl-ACP methyl ester carboxylesterase